MTIGPIGAEMFNPEVDPLGLVELDTRFLNPSLKLADRLTAGVPKTFVSSSIDPRGGKLDPCSGSFVENGFERTEEPDPNLLVLTSSCPCPSDPVAPGTKPANQPARRFSPLLLSE